MSGFDNRIYTTINYNQSIKYILSNDVDHLLSSITLDNIYNLIIVVYKIDDGKSNVVYNN
ncbi:MAG: hypothetical protein ACOCP8_00195 [archaeon]